MLGSQVVVECFNLPAAHCWALTHLTCKPSLISQSSPVPDKLMRYTGYVAGPHHLFLSKLLHSSDLYVTVGHFRCIKW
jgi:hypothetical protein